MKIAQIIASLDSRRGGPSRSSQGLARGLAKLGHEIELLSASSKPRSTTDGGVMTLVFHRRLPRVISPCPEMRRHLRQGNYEVLHNHGLWLRPLHYAFQESQRQGIPLVISPRGMMSPWSWRHHQQRKRFARHFVHPRALEQATGWHATSQSEVDDIRRLGFTQPVCVAPNGVQIPSDQELQVAREYWEGRAPLLKNTRVALFYSRLHSKKRVVELLDLWRTISAPDWVLLIVGIPDQFTVEQLEAQVLREGIQQRVIIFDGTYAPPPYAVADLFLLPSHSENFGLVIAEAMAAGVPPLTTTGTPWENLTAHEAGWCVDYSRYEQVLLQALREPPSDLAARGQAGHRWVREDFTWESVARRLAEFYRELHRMPR